jgi:microsomal dipeptidase-like Zn-dependent dipeptidase
VLRKGMLTTWAGRGLNFRVNRYITNPDKQIEVVLFVLSEDASQLPVLMQRLLVAGYRPEEFRKILGGNALHVLMEGWKK